MDFTDGLIPVSLQWAANALVLLLLAAAAWYAPWRRLAGAGRLNAFLGACVAVMLLWSMRAGVMPGLNFHILGMTTLTLMFGAPLALVAAAIVVAGLTLNGGADWSVASMNVLVMGLVPVVVTMVMLKVAQRRLPANYFIYVFINAFFVAGLSTLTVALVTSGLMMANGIYALDDLTYGYLPYVPMIFFAEALLNGMIMAVLVAYRPEWVATFDDDLYLRDPGRRL